MCTESSPLWTFGLSVRSIFECSSDWCFFPWTLHLCRRKLGVLHCRLIITIMRLGCHYPSCLLAASYWHRQYRPYAHKHTHAGNPRQMVGSSSIVMRLYRRYTCYTFIQSTIHAIDCNWCHRSIIPSVLHPIQLPHSLNLSFTPFGRSSISIAIAISPSQSNLPYITGKFQTLHLTYQISPFITLTICQRTNVWSIPAIDPLPSSPQTHFDIAWESLMPYTFFWFCLHLISSTHLLNPYSCLVWCHSNGLPTTTFIHKICGSLSPHRRSFAQFVPFRLLLHMRRQQIKF